ncbi:MAG: glycosyltransferase family 9 protein, partial [Candidatus Neomarinimicrobiota bacterium]
MIRFSSIGDIVLTAPVIQALRRSYPDLHIDYLVHERYRTLVDHFAALPDSVIPFPPSIGTAQLPAYGRQLAREGYELVIDLHDSLRSKILRKYLRPAEMRIYRKPRMKRWLLFYLWVNRFSPDFSVVGEYLLYAGLDAAQEEHCPRMTVDSDKSQQVCARLGLDQEYLVCIPGAAGPQKIWFADRYIDLFRRHLSGTQCQVVLLGGSQDAICGEIAAA